MQENLLKAKKYFPRLPRGILNEAEGKFIVVEEGRIRVRKLKR